MAEQAKTSYEKVDRKVEVMDTPYDRWISSQGIDVVRGFFVEDLYTTPLKWWDRMGGYGVYIMLDGTGYLDDAYVCAVPPGKSLNPQRHIYEALFYVLDGRGATTVWQTNGQKQSFEWQTGSLFAIPLNAWYQHFNGQGDGEARLLAVTTAPLVFNLFHCEDFVVNNSYSFTDRFKGEEGYFGGKGTLYNDRVVETKFRGGRHQHRTGGLERERQGQCHHLFRNVRKHDGLTCLAVSRGNLQKGAPPRPRRPCLYPHRQRLFVALARGERDDSSRLEAGIDRRSARGLVSPALQLQRRTGALSGAKNPQPQIQASTG